MPLGVRYFDPSGFFAGFGVTFVRQELDRSQNNVTEIGEGDSNFTILDAQIGYRLPKRFGIVTLQVSTTSSTRASTTRTTAIRESQDFAVDRAIHPERQVLLYLTLNW